MTRSAKVRSLVVLGSAGLLLAACSSGSSGSDASSAAPSSKSDGTLTVGTLLPQTGSLAFLGPPEFAGVDLALQEINAAGGVLGKPVTLINGDSGDTSTDIASQTVDRALSQGADAIIGAASSGVSLTVIDKITSAGAVQISPANTSPEFSTYQDNGLYFRTAPPDTFQGQVVGDLVAKDGNETMSILALDDSYGTGLAANVTKAYEAAGGTVASQKIYDPKASSYEAEVGEVKAANPSAVVLIGFDESKKIIAEMIKQGVGPQNVALYLVDGNLSQTIGDGLPAGALKGVKGTLPGAEATKEFQAQLLKVNPKLTDFSYAPESYDAMNLLAIAAAAANNDAGTAMASKMQQITNEGEKCTTYAECLAIIQAGKDADYEGKSGPIAFNSVGDPSKATMGIYQYGENNKYTPLEFVTGDVPEPEPKQ